VARLGVFLLGTMVLGLLLLGVVPAMQSLQSIMGITSTYEYNELNSSLHSGAIEIKTGDGSIVYNGYIYISGRDGNITRIDPTDYTYIINKTSPALSMIDAIVETGGYIWVGGIQDAHLYRLNATTLGSTGGLGVGYWQIFTPYTIGITAMCTDDTYIYCGGWDGNIAKFKISDNSITNATVNLSTGGGVNYFHSLCEDGSYLYGHVLEAPPPINFPFKIAKSDLSLTTNTSIAGEWFVDDIVQDSNYFYLVMYTESTSYGICRFAKSDLNLTNLRPSGMTGLDGLDSTDNILIVANKLTTDSAYTLFIIEQSDFTVRGRVHLVNLTGASIDHHSNEVTVVGDYIHLSRIIAATNNICLDKFNKADILAEATKGTLTVNKGDLSYTEVVLWKLMPYLIPAIIFGFLIAWLTGKLGGQQNGGRYRED